MSLLRVCAFVKCLNRRRFLEKCTSRALLTDCCQLCLSMKNTAVKRLPDTHLHIRRNVSFSVRKTDDAKKRVVKQSQLLDVLEARIQQLQPEGLLDVQKASVEFLHATSSGMHISAARTPTNTLPKRPDVSKSALNVIRESSKSQPTRWMEKLTLEKKSKMKKRQHLGEKLQKKHPGGKGNPNLPGTSYKKISTTVLIDDSNVNPSAQNAKSQKASKGKRKDPKKKPPSVTNQVTDEDLAQVEELEKRLTQQVNPWSYSNLADQPLQAKEGAVGNIRSCIFSWLEACVFAGDIRRANNFLFSQHRLRSRRAALDTDVYNIMLRVWAKKGTLNWVGRLFLLIEEAGLRPNIGSYCAALECMGRITYCSPQIVSRCLNQMEEDGISIDDIFRHSVFQLDERDMVLKAVRLIHPDYQPASKLNTSESLPSLVQDFYTKRDDHQYPKLDLTHDELQKRFQLQLKMEQACTVTIDSVEAAKPITENMAKMRALLLEQRAQWHKALLQAFREGKMNLGKTNSNDSRLNLYPYLCLLGDNSYVDIMLQSISSMPPSGESLVTLAKDLGCRVYTKYSVQQKYRNQMVEKLGNIYNAYTSLLAKDTKAYNILPREEWCKVEAEHPSGPTLLGSESSWPYIITLELGTYLLDLMVKNLKINSDILNSAYDRKRIPILYHMYTFRSNRQVGFIKPHPILIQMQQEAMESKLTFDSSVIPMYCPPVPWTSAKFGAYLLTPVKLMRSVDGATQHEELLKRCQNLHPVLDSLNQLGNCAWRINKPLLDIIISIFNNLGDDKLDIPPPMSEAPKIPLFNPQDTSYTATEKAHMKRDVINARKKCSEMHSLRMDALYKLSIANHIRDEVFWFPHNMDFRGRTYPCPPYFNHLGSDVTRSILLFAEGKPLGPKGLDWLKIHLVNLMGLKKRSSLQGRLEYANSIMEVILDSADYPLNGKKWWMNADEPWQALACCMEIANAVRSPDPTQFVSHFPVHQDGSCNGLQHYAALGRDIIGATSVNLMSCDVPQDVYSVVAQQVEEFRARDAECGLKIAQVLEGFINRKVVKQTVMTVVYGVTRYGGRLQIEKRLKEIDEFPKEYVWEASNYLVRQVFSGLKEMFTGTREIQDWLTESARLISKAGHTVQWVTPLGLPIIQPYHHTRNQMLRSVIQHINLQISHDTKQRPDTVKQKNAFPPNFIHSLDSTHMMLTALHCHSFGLTFVSVHDCFWTHALTVDTMNKVCREQFVALHNQPILQELSDFLLHKYCSRLTADSKNKKYVEDRRLMLLLARVPQTGDFDLNLVKESTYFFS
ncbi:DNA-directed RNA polymerase, mitochondrial [Corythoichthys intestinalis]|uniref:DNA-directed RNA polymerase, mitochondrial n=1 Tax=Corythoichthys intestinalis TaxID=161448 RepID=UPI0025A63E97|nr:DNA-directed RNA polymerase, mitochondrial [Corythoichthys intestinalis]